MSPLDTVYGTLVLVSAVAFAFGIIFAWVTARLFHANSKVDGYMWSILSIGSFVLCYMAIMAIINITSGRTVKVQSRPEEFLLLFIAFGIPLLLSMLTTVFTVKRLIDKPMPLFDKFF